MPPKKTAAKKASKKASKKSAPKAAKKSTKKSARKTKLPAGRKAVAKKTAKKVAKKKNTKKSKPPKSKPLPVHRQGQHLHEGRRAVLRSVDPRFLKIYLNADETRKPQFYRMVEEVSKQCRPSGLGLPAPELANTQIAEATYSAAMKIVWSGMR